MQQGYKARYEGRNVFITGSKEDPTLGYQFIIEDEKDNLLKYSEPVSAWALVYENEEEADEIFLSAFGLTADDALEMDIARGLKAFFICAENKYQKAAL